MNIFSLNSTEFLSILKTRKNDVKFSFFSSLYFSPYILCDQEYLSEGLKKLLPIILNTRFNMEMDELNYYYNNGMINKKEYNQTKENLIYSYYETTEDGKKIFKDFNENGKKRYLFIGSILLCTTHVCICSISIINNVYTNWLFATWVGRTVLGALVY